jgi:hypothetical protein
MIKMPRFFSRRLRKGDIPASATQDGNGSRGWETPEELDWSHARYVPLPPSPRVWEVREPETMGYQDPLLGPVLIAGSQGHHAKVVKLAAELSAGQLSSRAGEVVANAYRKLILQSVQEDHLTAAATMSQRMFEVTPSHVRDSDKRRFNRIIAAMDRAGTKHGFEPIHAPTSVKQRLFELSEEAPWTLANQRKFDKEERPDRTFKTVAVDRAGTWLMRAAKATTANPDAKVSIRRLDKTGHLVAKRDLDYDAYRIGIGAAGSSIAVMDSGGGLHIYDAAANVLVETDLAKDPRVLNHFRTIETHYWGEFRTQIRAVDVAPENDRYLFTLADEAWCCTLDGHALWGLRMPPNEGWERVVGRSSDSAPAPEVENALRLLGLSLPVSPDDIHRRWRQLALSSHPDLHPDDPHATEKTKRLNAAFQILTGVDPTTLSLDDVHAVHFERSAPDMVFDLGSSMTLGITISTGVPQDWVYAASFATNDAGAYVATYSGKVILLSREGRARIVYDLGVCPLEILDLGRYTYLLTHTRLYVVEDGTTLTALLDTYQQGRLIGSEGGFGLLTDKTLHWFAPNGTKLGSLYARDPIRAIYATQEGATIQTRQHEVEVRGLAI